MPAIPDLRQPRHRCTAARHETIKSDETLWLACTDPRGEMDDGLGGRIDLRNCHLCRSTLSRQVTP